MADPREKDSFTEHLLDIRHTHTGALHDLERLAAQEAVFYSVHLRKRPFAKEPLDLIGLSKHCSRLKNSHLCDALFGVQLEPIHP